MRVVFKLLFCALLSFSLVGLTPLTHAAQSNTATVQKKAVKKKTATAKKKKKVVAAKNKSKVAKRKARTVRRRGPSFAQLHGLRGSDDPLGLATSAVLAYNMNTNQVLYEKNAEEPLPIASITKLMTALVIVESGIDLDKKFLVTREDYVRSGARSKLRHGAKISRRDALHLALMSSDNRSAHFLGRTYPGGMRAFIHDMNAKAAMLGMADSVFYDSIGLNNDNRSSAIDLIRLIANAGDHEIIRDLSTTARAQFPVGRRLVTSSTTNSFIANDKWDIDLQKTGLTTAAGYCMVMQANISGEPIAMILLDAPNKHARNQDVEKLRSWLVSSLPAESETH